MNLRNVTLQYLGWCPGVKSLAMRIPDKEYSDRRVFAYSMTIFIVILGLSLYFSFARGPESYSWDIEFTEAAYDDVLDMYFVEKHASMDGVYNTSIWADTTAKGSILIRLFYQGPRDDLIQEWQITDGVIRMPPDEIGLLFNEVGPWRASTVWKMYSSSRDLLLHIRLQYLKNAPVWQPP